MKKGMNKNYSQAQSKVNQMDENVRKLRQKREKFCDAKADEGENFSES